MRFSSDSDTELTVNYQSCDFHQGKVGIPFIRTKSTNPETFIYVRNECNDADVVLEYSLKFYEEIDSDFCVQLQKEETAEYIYLVNSLLAICIEAITLAASLIILVNSVVPFAPLYPVLKIGSTLEKPFNMRLHSSDGISRFLTLFIVMYSSLYTVLTIVYPEYDALLIIESWLGSSGLEQATNGLIRYALGMLRGLTLGALSFAVILPNFSIPYSGHHANKVMLSLASIMIIDT